MRSCWATGPIDRVALFSNSRLDFGVIEWGGSIGVFLDKMWISREAWRAWRDASTCRFWHVVTRGWACRRQNDSEIMAITVLLFVPRLGAGNEQP